MIAIFWALFSAEMQGSIALGGGYFFVEKKESGRKIIFPGKPLLIAGESADYQKPAENPAIFILVRPPRNAMQERKMTIINRIAHLASPPIWRRLNERRLISPKPKASLQIFHKNKSKYILT